MVIERANVGAQKIKLALAKAPEDELDVEKAEEAN